MKTLLLLISLFALQQTMAQKIFSVDYESQADVKIYFVDYESQAGWRNSAKRYLFY